MTANFDELIRKAIEGTRLLRLRYNGKDRVVEPHDYGIHNGVVKLLTWQISGPANWRWFQVDRMSNVELLDQTFPGGRPTASGGHHKWDELFLRVRPSSAQGSEGSRSVSQ